MLKEDAESLATLKDASESKDETFKEERLALAICNSSSSWLVTWATRLALGNLNLSKPSETS